MSGGTDTPPLDEPVADVLQRLCEGDEVWAERYEGWIELGHGGSATVVRTHSKVAGEDIAVKVFTRVAPEEWQRFQQEVRNAQGLASPFIVRTYSPFRRGTLAWIELELVYGEDARHAVARRAREDRPFALEEVSGIGRALANALGAAHQAGVVHRDVKPANVLLPRTGTPAAKLGDFGTSRLASAARVTRTGLIAGTPQFCAPEVVNGQPAGPPADIYGFALCLYLFLSGGRFPFDLSDDAPPAQWLRAHADQAPRPLRQFRNDVPAALDALIARGLSKDPRRRPSAAEALDVLEGRTSVPAFSSSIGRGVAAASLALAALAALGVFVRSGSEDRPAGGPLSTTTVSPPAPSTVAVAPSTTATPPPAPRAVGGTPVASSTSVTRARVSRQGSIVSVRNDGARAWRELVVILTDDGGARHVSTVADGLAAGEELILVLDDFVPPPGAGFAPVRAELRLRDATGERSSVRVPVTPSQR